VSDGITITGGAGGTTAQLAELDAIAAALQAAAVVLDAAAAARARLGAVAGPGAASALAPFDGVRGLVACERDAHVLSERVRMAESTYADADAESAARMREVSVRLGSALGERGPVSLLWLVGGAVLVAGSWVTARLLRETPTPQGALLRWLGSPGVAGRDDWLGAVGRTMAGDGVLPRLPVIDRRATEGIVTGVGAYVWALLPGLQPVPEDPVPLAADLLAGLVRWRTGDTGLVVVPRVGARVSQPPRTEADLLRQVADLYPPRGGDSRVDDARVSVQRLDHADGTRSWVVAVPGTEALLSSTNPLDGLSDAELVGSVPDDATAMVVRAMAQAGIQPGEPVLMAGHSEGGMVAGRIASDPVLAQRFEVAAVVTAGSPMGGYDIPPTTAALHLEHSQDLVGGLSGVPNPDEVHRTTVVRDLSVTDDPVCWSVLDVADAHGIDRYVRTAELLPDDDPSVVGFRSAEARVLGPDVVSATTRTFTGYRVPEP
jgi:hypothetical protein